MRKPLITILLLGGSLLAAGAPATAQATESGAVTVRQAHRAVHRAERAAARAQARLREARHVESATRAASDRYGHETGRWVRLARCVGWPWGQIPALMLVIDRESGGDPAAKNPASTASGLLQLMSIHWVGKFNPLNPRLNLSYGCKLWRGAGWQPWSL